MKKNLSAFAFLVLSSASISAQAQGFYMFLDGGRSDFDTGFSSTPEVSVDEEDSMFSLGAGYRFNDYIALELGYSDLGKASASTNGPITGDILGSTVTVDGKVDADAQGYFVGFRGDAPINDSLSVFARAGAFNWESDYEISGTAIIDGDTFSGSVKGELDDGTDPYVGLGVNYRFTESFSMNLQYSRYMLEVNDEDVDIDVASVGLYFGF